MFKRADVFFLISAAIAFLFANYLWFAVDLVTGFFVALWVPSNLLLAFYFRVISSDATSTN
ncbi:MAG: hypothetical protein D6814_15475 [Calditrichaeota bacterium]|nr:MAG: hypothetical protein D6814_15475 [Calditrichota bacterium]